MGIKSKMEYVEKELGSDEKMLENTLKLEAFYKKHKKAIWIVIVIIITIFILKPLLSEYREIELNSANEALLILQKDPNNSEALATLESKNLPLFTLYTYANAIKTKDSKALEQLSKSKNSLIADISDYHSKLLASKSSESIHYKEMSMVEDAYLSIKAGKGREAREKLELIDSRSPVAPIAELLKHYTIKGK